MKSAHQSILDYERDEREVVAMEAHIRASANAEMRHVAEQLEQLWAGEGYQHEWSLQGRLVSHDELTPEQLSAVELAEERGEDFADVDGIRIARVHA